VVGGLLVTPRPSQAQAPGAAPTAKSPAGPSNRPAAGDLSPRAGNADHAGTDPASPSPEPAAGGLPDEVSLAELFPAEAAMGAASPDAAGPTGAAPTGQAGQAGADSGGGSRSRWRLIAGLVVTLAILVFGGGFVWWRNRDSAFFPA
jgi:hypothetical protein